MSKPARSSKSKTFSLELPLMSVYAISAIMECSGQRISQCIRSLIPGPVVYSAMRAYSSLFFGTDIIDGNMLTRVFIMEIVQQMQTHIKYAIPLQSIAQRLANVERYEREISSLYITWVKAIKGQEGFRFCQTVFEVKGVQHRTQIVLAPGQEEQKECDRIIGIVADEVLELNQAACPE